MSANLPPSLHLPERPQPRDMATFRADVLDRLGQGQPVVINAAATHALPLAWLQLLIAASKEATLQGTSVTVINPSFAFLFGFEALGLQPENGMFKLEFAP